MHLQHLCTCSNLGCIIHGYVPSSFGIGATIPLIKDKTGNIIDVNNYRSIILSPVISKLLKVVLMTVCNYAIFVLKFTVNNFSDRGSSVCVPSLNVRKAFDRVNH